MSEQENARYAAGASVSPSKPFRPHEGKFTGWDKRSYVKERLRHFCRVPLFNFTTVGNFGLPLPIFLLLIYGVIQKHTWHDYCI